MLKRMGRLPHDPMLLATVPRLGSYLPSAWPATGIDWSRNLAPGTWGMCCNDTLSDCTAAAVAHAVATWGSYCPPLAFMSDSDVVALYEETSGFRAGVPGTDEGARCLDVLHYWLDQPVGGSKLSAFCSIDPRNTALVKAGCEIFGGLYAGVVLRQSQLDGSQEVWDADNSTIEGGHAIWIVAANDAGLACITWGQVQRMTWDFWNAATDEAYALLNPAWSKSGRTPEGVQTTALVADMANL